MFLIVIIYRTKGDFNVDPEHGSPEIKTIYGALTTGDIWKFLQLVESKLLIDLNNYYISDLNKILSILLGLIVL